MQIDTHSTGLVLEGGGMRGVFTSGVLDAFMKHHFYFDYVVAVSAGACNGMSYISRQPRRARISNIDMLVKYDYIGLRHLVTQGCIFDQKLLYDRFPNELIPFDYDEFFRHSAGFEMVTTNCLTGRSNYLCETHDAQRAVDICRASSSLPYVSKIVEVDGQPMGFRESGKDRKIPHFIYKNYPRLRVALSHRIEAYNRQLQLLEDLEHQGRVACLRPKRPMEVRRIEKNVDRLERLYEEGFSIGEEFVLNNDITGAAS